MQALLRLIVLFALLAISLGQMAGGWRQADATDVNVIASARFAVNEALGTDAEFKILDANKQVSEYPGGDFEY
jgi:beta-lactam-binding protein with PASTA domain